MMVLYVLVPMAILLAASAVVAFLWAARDGQLDDLETPPLRMLHDEDDWNPSDESAGRRRSR
jgi:cbb3-type cytochrome oxidase maturation protein